MGTSFSTAPTSTAFLSLASRQLFLGHTLPWQFLVATCAATPRAEPMAAPPTRFIACVENTRGMSGAADRATAGRLPRLRWLQGMQEVHAQ